VTSIASKDYVDTCHAKDIEVWALFSNEFPSDDGSRYFDSEKTDQVLAYTSKREKVISEVISYVTKYGIDGINIDFELISQEGADDYIEFIRELSIACRANNIILSVDNYVPEYTYYYNRREQGIVADYVVIMGYDETPAGSDTPGPVASLNFVRKGITDTLNVVDKSKVINGIPFYTRVWCTTADGNVSSFACGMAEALGYLTDHNVIPQFVEDMGLNYGSYTSEKDGNFYAFQLFYILYNCIICQLFRFILGSCTTNYSGYFEIWCGLKRLKYIMTNVAITNDGSSYFFHPFIGFSEQISFFCLQK
jgi:spore germination protein YaaH